MKTKLKTDHSGCSFTRCLGFRLTCREKSSIVLIDHNSDKKYSLAHHRQAHRDIANYWPGMHVTAFTQKWLPVLARFFFSHAILVLVTTLASDCTRA